MTKEKLVKYIFETECGHRLEEISLFSFERFKEQGRGIVIIEPDNTSEDKFSYHYSTESQTEDYMVDLSEYEPGKEIMILMVRPDGTKHIFVEKFLDPLLRPGYLYDLKNMFDLFKTPQTEDTTEK